MLLKQVVEKDRPIYAIQFSADDIWSFVDEILRRHMLYEYDMENPTFIIVSGQSGRRSILRHGWWIVFYDTLFEVLDSEEMWRRYEERY